jgi:hypothetical protein
MGSEVKNYPEFWGGKKLAYPMLFPKHLSFLGLSWSAT